MNKRLFTRNDNLERELVKLVIVSSLAALVVYVALSALADSISENPEIMSSFVTSRLEYAAQNLQAEVGKQDDDTLDAHVIDAWTQADPVTDVVIIAGDDFVYPNSLVAAEVEAAYNGVDNDTGFYRFTLLMPDGSKADAYLFGSYDYFFYVLLRSIVAAIAIVAFFIVFLTGIRRRIAYVKNLKEEIVALGGGDLSVPVTVEGSDELSELAEQLDEMRQSLVEQIAAEQRAVNANVELVTTMSHDLRTPITSLLLYLQILRDGRYKDTDQAYVYLEKAYDRAMQVKNLSDSLFHRFLAAYTVQEDANEKGPLSTVLGDLLSNLVASLEAAGFTVISEGSLEHEGREVDVVVMSRIVDNLLSNLLKYADPTIPVCLTSRRDETACLVTLTNAISPHPSTEESSGLGVSSIERLMEQLGGSYEHQVIRDAYLSRLVFPRHS